MSFPEQSVKRQVMPRIGYDNGDGTYTEIYGHGCRTFEQADRYCQVLSKKLIVINKEDSTQPLPGKITATLNQKSDASITG